MGERPIADSCPRPRGRCATTPDARHESIAVCHWINSRRRRCLRSNLAFGARGQVLVRLVLGEARHSTPCEFSSRHMRNP